MKMKAAIIKQPGQIVVEQVEIPQPGPGDVLLKVEACAICGTDQRVLKGEKHVDVPIVGHEIAGTVVEVGAAVPGVKPGERYAVQTVIGCGHCAMCAAHVENLCENGFTAIGYQFNGGFAEYMIMPAVAVRQGCLIPIPKEMPADVATLIEPLSCCVNGMRCIPMEQCKHVVIFGGGIIGVLNGLVAKARGAKVVTIMDVSQERLDLHRKLGLPFDNYVNSRTTDPVAWVKAITGGKGVDAVVVAASVKSIVPIGLKILGRSGHLSIFAGMPKSDPHESIDLNLIHYLEHHVHGANSSAIRDYIEAREYLVSGKINGGKLVTHTFKLDDFNEAVKVQGNPATGAMKVIIVP
ncbi:MAG: alcohol dehydrogenase catalytic domain-containing protein [bacterium]